MNIAEAPSSQELNFLAETFRLLGDPSRLKILLHCEDGPKSVTDISEALELSQSLVSHHLRLLRGARLVTRVSSLFQSADWNRRAASVASISFTDRVSYAPSGGPGRAP